MKITSHRELEVWIEAMNLAMDVFAMTKRFPTDERFSLTDQIRRSSRSVAANLSEAWRKRRYEAAFVSKLNDSEGEAAETQTHLEIALRCGYLTADQFQSIDARYETLLARIVTMSSQPEKWILRTKSPLRPVSSSPLPSD
jgi:four helix bundle protein